jgi:hypothetical protein
MNDRPVVDFTGLSKAEVLAALFNASAPGGMGFLQAGNGPQVMSVDDAQRLIDEGYSATSDYAKVPGRPMLYFDYVYGRPLKLNLTEDDSFDPWGFDRDNGGDGASQKIIDRLRATKDVNPPESQEAHVAATHENAFVAMDMVKEEGGVTEEDLFGRPVKVFKLGCTEFAEPIKTAVQEELDRLAT